MSWWLSHILFLNASVYKNGIDFIYECLVEFPSRPTRPEVLFVEMLLTTNSISLIYIWLFRLSIYSWVSFDSFVSSRIFCPFHLSYWIYGHRVVHNILIFLFAGTRVLSSLFLIWAIKYFSFFFLIHLAKNLSVLLIFSKDYLWVLLITSVIFSVSYFLYLCTDLSVLLLIFNLSLFSSFLR